MPLSGLEPARALTTLQRLLEIPGLDLHTALVHASNALADAFSADKVDAFIYDEARDSLAALGTSTQPLSNLQKNLGLDVLPISNGGLVVRVFQSGEVLRTPDAQQEADELKGIKEGLRIRGLLAVPLSIASKRRGVIAIASLEPDFFGHADEAFVKAAATWVGVVAHRAELMEEIGRNALEQGRRAAADELITVLAHDVRNYLAPISERLYLLRHDAEKREDKTASEHAQRALRSVTGLSKLVTNLLDVARLDRGLFDLDLEPVDLVAIAEEAAGILSRPDHPVIVEASSAVLIAADRVRLRQCLDNIISNALGYSPRSAPVNVFIDEYNEDGIRWARVEVVDEGPGVPQEMLAHIFDRFVSGRVKSGGMGLGLYLANRIAQAHGGRIHVESEPGKGARFKLSLPLHQRAPAS
jgi:signal transduction histidine kinase